MFEKSLQDMVKDLRVHAQNNLGLDKYISAELQKIKSELRKNDTTIKVNAVAKLTYLKIMRFRRRACSEPNTNNERYH